MIPNKKPNEEFSLQYYQLAIYLRLAIIYSTIEAGLST